MCPTPFSLALCRISEGYWWSLRLHTRLLQQGPDALHSLLGHWRKTIQAGHKLYKKGQPFQCSNLCFPSPCKDPGISCPQGQVGMLLWATLVGILKALLVRSRSKIICEARGFPVWGIQIWCFTFLWKSSHSGLPPSLFFLQKQNPVAHDRFWQFMWTYAFAHLKFKRS